MKTIVKILITILVMTSSTAFAGLSPKESIHVISTKRYVMYFKAAKEMIGATVSVYDAKNNLVKTEQVVTSKTIVDFFELKAGSYTIKIVKGQSEFTYSYINHE